MKKPFYKRPLFIIILVIVAIALFKTVFSGKASRSHDQNTPSSGLNSQLQTERARSSSKETEKASSSSKETETKPSTSEAPVPVSTSEPLQVNTTHRDDSLIRPEVKEAIDSYEAFIDEYCAFLESYDASDATMLIEYASLVEKDAQMEKEFDEIADMDLTEAEDDYYFTVSLRCEQKLLEAMSKLN